MLDYAYDKENASAVPRAKRFASPLSRSSLGRGGEDSSGPGVAERQLARLQARPLFSACQLCKRLSRLLLLGGLCGRD